METAGPSTMERDMTLLDQMEKRPGTVIVALALLSIVAYAGLFVGALFVIKWIFF